MGAETRCLPALTLTSNGILTGNSDAIGTFDVSVTAYRHQCAAAIDSSVRSRFDCAALAITTATLPNGTEGTPYSATIGTSGGTPPISFSITQANFPPGLTITQPPVTSTTDTLAGTPTLAGNYTFSESVADSGSPTETATQNYTVTVASAAAHELDRVASNNIHHHAYLDRQPRAGCRRLPHSLRNVLGCLYDDCLRRQRQPIRRHRTE